MNCTFCSTSSFVCAIFGHNSHARLVVLNSHQMYMHKGRRTMSMVKKELNNGFKPMHKMGLVLNVNNEI